MTLAVWTVLTIGALVALFAAGVVVVVVALRWFERRLGRRVRPAST